VETTPFKPANMGFRTDWSDIFRDRFAGQPLKNIRLSYGEHSRQGELMITRDGIEGGAVYALSAALRDALETNSTLTLSLDLRPDLSLQQVSDKLTRTPAHQSLSNRLRKALNFTPLSVALLRECGDLNALAPSIKALPVVLNGTQSLDRAISSAGGITFSSLTDALELKALPGVYATGEMLDWEAPTGGYLLQACFSSAVHVARHISQSLSTHP
ncbi:MAG: NAD(P)/FAD-dependent oxidoreductase, partial [Asticcacaulis sp.]